MTALSQELIKSYRAVTFKTQPESRLNSINDAVNFVNDRGFVLFWANKNMILPSIWVATAGDRLVPDEHDDPGHVCWGWKDELLGKKVWYYGRVIHKRNAMLSTDILPYFYALSPNYGDPENDYLEEYRQGLLTQEAKAIYEILLREGPLDTLTLRQLTRLSNTSNKPRFLRGLEGLQSDFRILPTGVAQVGSWNYAFIYDIVTRHLPDLIDESRYISETQARHKLLETYLRSVGGAQYRDITHIFGWKPDIIKQTVEELISTNRVINQIEIENTPGEWIITPALVG